MDKFKKSGDFNRLRYIIFQIVTLIFLLIFVPSGFARDFTFTWEANHPNDNVVKYRVYWRTTSGGYKASNRQDIPVSSLPDPSNPRHTLSLQNASEDQTYFFVCSAVDNHGYESDYSEEINSANQDPTPPPDPPTDTTPPVFTTAPDANGITLDSGTIAWTTNESSNSEVRYGTSSSTWSNYAWASTKDALVKTHALTLSNLSEGQKYYYRVASTDSSGNRNISSEYSFTTLEDQDPTPPPDPPTDTTPPVFTTAPDANGITLDSGTIAWTTNESSNSEVRYGTSSSTWNTYAWASKKDALGTAHSITLSNLSLGQKYYYRVASTDSSGNQIISNEYSFTTLEEPDTAPPEFTSWPTVTETTDDTAIIEWSTDEQSDSTIRYGLTPSTWENYNFEIGSSSMTKNHRITLTNLNSSTTYYCRVASSDIQGNGPLISSELTFTTDQEPDEEEPEITSPPTVISIFETEAGIQSGVINAGMAALATDDGNISVAIAWKTDELSNSELRYGKKRTTWDQYSNTVVDDALVKKHTVILTGLREEERYYFRAASTDALGNGPTSDPNEINNPFKEQSFLIKKPSDNEAPRIVNGPHLKAIDKNSAVIVWETDEPASSMLQYGLSTAEWGEFDHSKVNTDMGTVHSMTLSGLSATTQYFFMVGAMDATGNGPGKNDNPSNPSVVDSFWTTGIVDETPPDISAIEVLYATDTTALIQWETDEPGNSMVQYDLCSRTWGQYEYTSNDSEMVMSHQLTLTKLKPDTIYYFRLSSTDARGNGPGVDSDLSNPSEELTFQTATVPDEAPPQISEVNIIMRDDGKSVIVEWFTDEPGNSQVAYGPEGGEWDSYAYHENSPELTREHSVALTNLETGITYYVRVSSMDASGNDHEALENDDNPSQELTFQLGSDMAGSDIVTQKANSLSHSASEVSCFISATGN
jgi:hypothetical protein